MIDTNRIYLKHKALWTYEALTKPTCCTDQATSLGLVICSTKNLPVRLQEWQVWSSPSANFRGTALKSWKKTQQNLTALLFVTLSLEEISAGVFFVTLSRAPLTRSWSQLACWQNTAEIMSNSKKSWILFISSLVGKKMLKTLFKAIRTFSGCKTMVPASYFLRSPWHIKSCELKITNQTFRKVMFN